MQAASCKPDFITFTALVSAYEKGGQWMRALQARRPPRADLC
jgi:pentatricopeptide repeat domain-containing protein 1